MRPKLSAKQVHQFTFQLATLLQNQLPLAKALHLMADTARERAVKRFLHDIIQQIHQGQPLHLSLAEYPKLFNSVFLHLVRIGESMGCLAGILLQLAARQKEQQQLQKQLIKALSYPLFILLFALLMCAVLLLKVIPEFARLFQQFEQNLPVLTQQIIDLSAWLQEHITGLVIALSSLWLMLMLGKRFYKMRNILAWLTIRLPFIGNMILYANIIQYSQTLKIMLTARVSLDKALNIASDLELNPSVKRQVKQLATTVQQGKSIRQYTTQGHSFGLLPPYMLQILSIGEETSHCSQLLDSLIADYQQRLHNMIQISMSLIEPALMLGLGLLIGLLIMAVYLPLFNLGNLF